MKIGRKYTKTRPKNSIVYRFRGLTETVNEGKQNAVIEVGSMKLKVIRKGWV